MMEPFEKAMVAALYVCLVLLILMVGPFIISAWRHIPA